MKYYSSIKNEVMEFAGEWIDLKVIILSEVAQIQTNARCPLSYVDTSSELSDRCV